MVTVDRKHQILETAAEILEQKSFAAFSYQDLASRLDIRKASIHHHFPTKDDLGQALIAYYEGNADQVMGQLANAGSPGKAMAGMLDLAESVLLDSTTRVCPSGAFEVDTEALSDAMQQAIRAMKQRHLARTAEMLAAARETGEISFLGSAIDQAAAIMAALQGARESSRILGREHFRAVVRQLKRCMGL